MGGRSRITILLMGGLFALFANAEAPAQGLMLIGQDQASAWFEQVRPSLEKTGIRLGPMPQVRTILPREWSKVSDPELETQLCWQFPDLEGDTFEHVRKEIQESSSSTIIARHQQGADVIWILPFSPALVPHTNSRAGDSERLRQFVQLAMIHEAVRCFLERRHGLVERRRHCKDGEEFKVLQAMVEGVALRKTEAVAREMGVPDLVPILTRRFSARADDQAPDPGRTNVYRVATLARKTWAISEGYRFLAALEHLGVHDVEGQVFSRLPFAESIDHPERYLKALQEGKSELDRIASKLGAMAPGTGWSSSPQPCTADMVRQAASLFRLRERAEQILATWEEARMVVWKRSEDPSRQVAVSLVRFGSPASARAYHGFAIDLQRRKDELLGVGAFPSVKVLDTRSSTIAMGRADEAVRCDNQLKLAQVNEPTTVSMILARGGDVVVEFYWYGAPADMAWAEQILETILAGSGPR